MSSRGIIKDGREYQKNENFAPKQDKRDCPLTGQKCRKPVFMRAYGICFIKWCQFLSGDADIS